MSEETELDEQLDEEIEAIVEKLEAVRRPLLSG